MRAQDRWRERHRQARQRLTRELGHGVGQAVAEVQACRMTALPIGNIGGSRSIARAGRSAPLEGAVRARTAGRRSGRGWRWRSWEAGLVQDDLAVAGPGCLVATSTGCWWPRV